MVLVGTEERSEENPRVKTAYVESFLKSYLFYPYPLPCSQTLTRHGYPCQKSLIVFQTIIKPIIFCRKTDQYPRRFTVTRDDDILFFRQT
jgi:hypothetical protein